MSESFYSSNLPEKSQVLKVTNINTKVADMVLINSQDICSKKTQINSLRLGREI